MSRFVPNKVNPYTGEVDKYYESGFFEWLLNLTPISARKEVSEGLEQEAMALGNKTTGLAGRFEINGKDYNLTGAEKEKYAKYRAEYLQKQYGQIIKGNQKVTVKTDEGKYITTTYNKLTTEQKSKVLDQMYNDASSKTRIKYWLDGGNMYYTSNKEEYAELRKLFGNTNIKFNTNWKKSKFVEG